MLVLKRGNTHVPYKHIIVPKKDNDGKFQPNYEAMKKIQETSTVYMLMPDFEKYQREGETIIINQNGGWCTLTPSDKLA